MCGRLQASWQLSLPSQVRSVGGRCSSPSFPTLCFATVAPPPLPGQQPVSSWGSPSAPKCS
ncbi:hypothetical protein QP144_24465, partial [Escherichia coli]|nr:hypothetical protein [Escherichia coli]